MLLHIEVGWPVAFLGAPYIHHCARYSFDVGGGHGGRRGTRTNVPRTREPINKLSRLI